MLVLRGAGDRFHELARFCASLFGHRLFSSPTTTAVRYDIIAPNANQHVALSSS